MVDKQTVAVASLGGTITMMPDKSGGISPTLDAAQLLAAVPGLSSVAHIQATTLITKPGASLVPREVMNAVEWARQSVDDGAAGAVLIQGTDTIEETSYLAELVWDRPQPLVFVGAMRGPAQPSADGPANLLAACLVASCDRARDKGVLVALDNCVHQASLVHKAHSTALSAFRSYGNQVLGHIVEGQVRLAAFNRRGTPLPLDADSVWPFVPLWTTWWGDDGRTLRSILDAAPAGLVVAGFGVGHVSTTLADVIEEAAARMPVVLSTRIGEGGAMRATYGFPGSEIDLQRRGAIVSGTLDPYKARLLLSALLAAGASHTDIADSFLQRGLHNS